MANPEYIPNQFLIGITEFERQEVPQTRTDGWSVDVDEKPILEIQVNYLNIHL